LIGGLAFAVCAGSALAIYLRAPTPGTSAPPPPGDRDWRWVGAGPGLNLYYRYRTRPANGMVSVWVDRRHFSNLAGVTNDLVDSWDVDCGRRRLRAEPGPASSVPHEQLLRAVCTDIGSRYPAPWAAERSPVRIVTEE
jgi:hypothetical protein